MLIPLIVFIAFFFTRCWLILPKRDVMKKKKRVGATRTCIFLGSGGHTGEMLQLIKSLDSIRYNPRTYVVANTDMLSEEKAIEHERQLGQGNFQIFKIPRAREVGQSWSSVPLSVMFAILSSIKVMVHSKPDLILCNGPGSCIPICILAYIPRFLGIKKIEIIYVESFARVETLSMTGKLLYPFVDRFLVQWPQLTNKYSRSEYKGFLV